MAIRPCPAILKASDQTSHWTWAPDQPQVSSDGALEGAQPRKSTTSSAGFPAVGEWVWFPTLPQSARAHTVSVCLHPFLTSFLTPDIHVKATHWGILPRSKGLCAVLPHCRGKASQFHVFLLIALVSSPSCLPSFPSLVSERVCTPLNSRMLLYRHMVPQLDGGCVKKMVPFP